MAVVTENPNFLTVTPEALKHFRGLIAQEETEGMNLRVSVVSPSTPYAKVEVTYCPKGEEVTTDFAFKFGDFNLYIESMAVDALTGAEIGFAEDELGGQLSIKAPNLKGNIQKKAGSLKERIEDVLEHEINPNLAGHGGQVRLIELLENESVAILKFGGGCQGCGMANVTLKQGIERTLKERFPEILEVRDSTDHSAGENPYY